MKTVAHLLPNYNPFPPVYPAGTELRVAEVSRRQARYHPVVICGGFPGQSHREVDGTMEIQRIHFGRTYRRLFQKITRIDPWPYGQRMWHRILAAKAEIIHIHNEPKLLAMLAPFLRRHPIKTVVHIANDKRIDRELVPLVSKWVACSQFMAGWLADHIGVPPDSIEVIYTGVDTTGRPPIWEVDQRAQLNRRQRWGLTKSNVVFLFAGRLVKEKGLAELLDAFDYVVANHPSARLLVAGNVRDSKDPNNEKACYGKAITSRMASMKNVLWVGSLHPAAMHDFLLTGDVFVLPSLWHDPFPTVMLEAACAGIPVIASRRGGITEFLDGCPQVPLVDHPEDPMELARAISALSVHADLREEAGRWLRHKINSYYDWHRVAADFEKLYDSLERI